MNRLESVATRLIAQDTESRCGNLAAMAELAERLEGAGFTSRLQRWGEGAGEKANLVAWGGPPEPDGLILSGHLDVVPFRDQPGWTHDPLRLEADDERLYGRGTSDMKVFLAQCVDAACELDLGRLRRPVVFLFTSDEEIGCLGAARLAPELDTLLGEVPKPALAWIGEPTSWNVFHTHKGIVAFGVTVCGQGGHSSVPEAGVNAIAVAAQALASVGALQAELRGRGRERFQDVFPEAPYTTLNFGTIQGGTASNMIAERCDFTVSYRPLPDEDPLAVYHEARTRLIENVPRDWGSARAATLEVSEPLLAPGLLTPPGTALEAALRAELGPGPLGGAPFCTDGGRFEAAGIRSLICGPGDLEQAHQPNESISRAAFASGTQHILRVVERLCGPGA
ncbi:MAG: acetylornithine deacetylase [Myxococcota bacterium]